MQWLALGLLALLGAWLLAEQRWHRHLGHHMEQEVKALTDEQLIALQANVGHGIEAMTRRRSWLVDAAWLLFIGGSAALEVWVIVSR